MITLNSPQKYDIIHIPTQNVTKDVTIEPKLIIAHCIGLPLFDVIKGLTLPLPEKEEQTKGLGVSSHYFIPQISGQEFLDEIAGSGLFETTTSLTFPDMPPVICFARENQRTLHAGHSSWGQFNKITGCEIGLNSCSIGIEFHAPGYGQNDKGKQDWFAFTPYTDSQIEIGALLMKDIIARWGMTSKAILAHSDIAPYFKSEKGDPLRIKTDPGPLFPWSLMADEGLGFYPKQKNLTTQYNQMTQQDKEKLVRMHLNAIGYNITTDASQPWGISEKHIVNAYKMHYMQKTYTTFGPESDDFGQIDEALIMSLEGWHQEESIPTKFLIQY